MCCWYLSLGVISKVPTFHVHHLVLMEKKKKLDVLCKNFYFIGNEFPYE